jgi:hypothetical protein
MIRWIKVNLIDSKADGEAVVIHAGRSKSEYTNTNVCIYQRSPLELP